MSLFICPNATRSLLRLAARGSPPKAAGTQLAPAPRWLSCSAAHSSPMPFASRIRGPTTRGRNHLPGSIPNLRYADRRSFFSPRVIRKYEELPHDYRDQAGLRFKGRDLVELEITDIFGPGIGAVAGNHLLRILHGRRVAGTLDDPAFAVHTAQFTPEQMERALEYLRKTIPVEEVVNAGLRAEDELAEMEEAEEAKRQSAGSANTETDADGDQEATGNPIYGVSTIDKIRARNIAKRKAQERAQEEERQAAEARGESANAGPLAEARPRERQITNPRIAEYYAKAQSDLEQPPELSATERIAPSATVVALVLGLLAAVCTVYEEPAPRYRLFREVSTAHATVGTLIAVNAAVLALWRVPPLWRTFNKYMMVVVATARPVTMFTAVFSHQSLTHLLLNAVPLWFVGTALHAELGRADFLTLYAGCGAAGFLASLATYTLRGMLTVTTLGASGAVLGVTSAFLWAHRDDGFRFLGLPEGGVHGVVLLALVVAAQLGVWGRTVKLSVDLASHVAGLAAGVAGIEVIGWARGWRDQERGKVVFNVVGAPGAGRGQDGVAPAERRPPGKATRATAVSRDEGGDDGR